METKKGIFEEWAPKYWAAGYSVIPLIAGQKRPALAEWSKFGLRMATAEEQADWLVRYANCNIGLPTGVFNKVVTTDVDTDVPSTISLIESIMPNKSPWKRVGAKGYMGIYKMSDEKSFSIKTAEGQTIFEVQSTGRQIVLPPSIHPDTSLPYTANCDLLNVLGHLPPLPRDFEKNVRGALALGGMKLSLNGHSRMTEVVPKSSRDNICTSKAGLFANDVMRGYLTVRDAVGQIRQWAQDYTEKSSGDNLDPDEAVRKMLKFITRDVREHGRPLPVGWEKDLSEEELAGLGLEFGQDEQQWPYQAILDDFRQSLDASMNEEARLELVQRILQTIKRSTNLDTMQVEHLLKILSQTPGVRTPLPALRKQLATFRQGGLRGEDHAEIVNHMIDDLNDRAEIRHWDGKFREWSGIYWAEKDAAELRQHITTRYSGLPTCKRDGDYDGILRTFRNMVTKPLAEVPIVGINFVNGFLTAEGELVSHDAKFGQVHVLPYSYVPEKAAMAPKFFKLLKDAWGGDVDGDDKVLALQEALCATLFGLGPKMSRAVLLYGEAGSGKSTILKILEGLLPPELVSATSPNQWADKFLPAQMVGKMLNIGGEMHEKSKIDGQIFKQIITGDPITVQHKNQQAFKVSPGCMHWFASNHLPQSDDMSEGFLRRWLILVFNLALAEAERNINLAEDILLDEREAIVAWAVSALGRLAKQNCYTLPRSHGETIERVLVSLDTVFSFIRQSPLIHLVPLIETVGTSGASSFAGTLLQPLYEAYLNFTANMGVRGVGRMRFLQQMQQHAKNGGYKVMSWTSENGSPETGFHGLTLRGARSSVRTG